MKMTTKEIVLLINDRITNIEEQLAFQHRALHDITDSCAMIASGLKTFIDDFYGDDTPKEPQRVIPLAAPEGMVEKMNDPEYMRDLAARFTKEVDDLEALEEELAKVKDEILTGEMGES